MDRAIVVTAVGDLESLMVGMKLELFFLSKVLHLVLNRGEQQEGGKTPSCGGFSPLPLLYQAGSSSVQGVAPTSVLFSAARPSSCRLRLNLISLWIWSPSPPPTLLNQTKGSFHPQKYIHEPISSIKRGPPHCIFISKRIGEEGEWYHYFFLNLYVSNMD